MQEADKRDYPRIESEASVEIITNEDRTYPALVLDVSLTGAQLLCDRPTAKQAAPHLMDSTTDIAQDMVQDIAIRLRLKLRDRSTVRAQIHCTVMSVREVGEDEFRLGLKYNRFHNKSSYQALEDYVDDWLN